MVDSCLHCKFRNGAWRPRAAFQDRVLSFEDRIIYIDISNYVRKTWLEKQVDSTTLEKYVEEVFL